MLEISLVSHFPYLVLGNDLRMKTIKLNKRLNCGETSCANLSIKQNKLCKPAVKIEGKI